MSDEHKGYDPANQAPAEGQSREIPAEDRGQAPNVDPAAKDAPAEGGRDEVESGGASRS
ncbi:hypothetical protein SAMN04488058_11114 [Deinococcus reticulitermitis]|uniref:Uncharacterized protein n=1 Tax=Deinococcus reticulitermitis TaxID=856736 RepID=A0A1H6ZZL7_9DEIO|nr:hypothetical protein [Deinococcus reticulitermitis]SEJ57634.1 hypothetical protein SAMN04488058_11114 [Deinococcus reticulitermitis]